MDRLEPSKVIKNKEYLKALVEYVDCVDIVFNQIKLKRNFDHIINAPQNSKECFSQAEELKKIINNGGLDYDNFTS